MALNETFQFISFQIGRLMKTDRKNVLLQFTADMRRSIDTRNTQTLITRIFLPSHLALLLR